MTPQQKADNLVNSFRMILMNEDTDCGYEIVCTTIAIQHAQIVCDEIIGLDIVRWSKDIDMKLDYWSEVKQILGKM